MEMVKHGKRTTSIIFAGMLGLLTVLPAFAEENPDLDVEKSFTGYGGFLAGAIAKGYGRFEPLANRKWIENCYLGIMFDATVNERMRVLLNAEMYWDFSWSTSAADIGKENKAAQFWGSQTLGLRQAVGSYTFGDLEQYPLKITAGLWRHKYNPEVRNLGEYLFRANAYPTYMYNNFDDPTAPLLGVMLSTNFIKWLNWDIMFSSETQRYPLRDFSLATIVSAKPHPLVDVGIGLNADHFIAAENKYSYVDVTLGQPGYRNFANIDTVTGDTTYFHFRSVKAMARLTLDPKAFFGEQTIFGKDDLKLYGEYAILGFEDQGGNENDFYMDIGERMPWMVGFNFPTFKVLDVLACEFEYFKNPYIPGYAMCYAEGIPRPVENYTGQSLTDFYWSIYAKRTLGAFALTFQIGRDHVRPTVVNFFDFTEKNDVLLTDKHFWWITKVHFGF